MKYSPKFIKTTAAYISEVVLLRIHYRQGSKPFHFVKITRDIFRTKIKPQELRLF